MYIVQRRVVSAQAGWVRYERTDCPAFVIDRTIQDHIAAVGKEPVVGELIDFECHEDPYDSPFYVLVKKEQMLP